jgi:3-hydroxybutyryl-CoA dehydrogenase
MNIKQVGVVGCGLMGSGIVQVCAQNGYKVIVSDISQPLVDKGLASIKSSLNKAVEKGKLTSEQMDSILKNIKGTINIVDLRDCDLIIEAATENIVAKKAIFSNLAKIDHDNMILATNTSCLSIIDIAKATNRPERVLGMHFFNPVPAMALVEIVPTLMTNPEIVQQVQTFGNSLGKTIVIAKDTPGFIVNRLLIPYLLNAIRLLENGVATKEEIDTGMKLGLNHPLGPLALSDLIGLDVVNFISLACYEELKDPQFIAPILLKKMVAGGWLGRKSGKGFYEYK